MAGGRKDIEAGSAFVRVYLKQTELERGIKDLQRNLKSIGSSATTIGKGLLGMSAAVLGPLAYTVKAASDMEETMNKFDVVFAENSASVKKWADSYAAEVGRSKQQIAEFVSNLQTLFMPMGFSSEQAEEMSKTMTALAVDLASFHNKVDADVLRDLQSAMTGSSETMKKYGVIVTAAAVGQELLNQGIDPKNATEAEKAQARLAIILRGTVTAQGDAVRSAGSFSNQMKALEAAVNDSATAIGEALIPVVTPLVTDLAEMAKETGEWLAQNHELVVTIAKVAVGVGAAGIALVAFGQVATGAAAALGVLSKTMLFVAANPAVLLLGALVALGVAIHKATSYTAELADAMDAQLAENDKLRKSDQQRMAELEQLARKQKLTSAEMDRAKSIISELEGRYGALGLSIDEATGSITGMADAQDRLNAKMRELAVDDVKARIAELQANIAEMSREMQADMQVSWGSLNPATIKAEGEKAMSAHEQRINAEQAKLRAANARLRALRAGDTEAIAPVDIAGAGPAGIAGGGIGPSDAALAFNERMLDQIAKERIDRIEDEQKRAIAAINARYDAEMEKARELGADLKLVDKARNAAIKTVKVEAERKRQEELDRQQESRRVANQRLQDDIAEMDIELALPDDPTKTAEQRAADNQERERRKLELQRQIALRDAGPAGASAETINAYYDKQLELLAAAPNIEKATKAAEGPSGTFSAHALAALGGGGGPAERAAKAAEETAKGMRAFLKKIDELLAVNKDQLDATKDVVPTFA